MSAKRKLIVVMLLISVFFIGVSQKNNDDDSQTHVIPRFNNNVEIFQSYDDLVAPNININSENGTYTNTAPIFSVNFSDDYSLNSAYFTLNDSLTTWELIFENFDGKDTTALISLEDYWSSLSDGNYTMSFKVEDDNGNVNDNSTPTIWFIKDTLPPLLECYDISVYLNTPPSIPTYIYDDYSLDKVYYLISLYGLVDETGWTLALSDIDGDELSTSINITLEDWNKIDDGFHEVYFKLTDDLDNEWEVPYSSCTFCKDTTAPRWDVETEVGSIYSETPQISVDFFDCYGLNNASYKLDDGIWQQLFTDESQNTKSVIFDISSFSTLSQGEHTIFFMAMDDIGNLNSSTLDTFTFIKDTIAPSININSENGTYTNIAPIFSVDFCDDYSLNNAYFTLNDSLTTWEPVFENYNGKDTTALISLEDYWSSLPDGNYTMSFKVEDDNGNVNDNSTPTLWFIKDTLSPLVECYDIPVYFNSPPSIPVYLYDDYSLDKVYYLISLDGIVDETDWTLALSDIGGNELSTTINITLEDWNKIDDGIYEVYFKLTDDLDNEWEVPYSICTFCKDTTAPTWDIETEVGSIYSETPQISVDFYDRYGLNNASYKLDDGIWQELFTDEFQNSKSITFDISSFSTLPQGEHTIFFMAMDDIGNVNSSTLDTFTFIKDTTAPSININSENGTYTNTAPIFSVDFSDSYSLNNAYFTLNDSLTTWEPVFENYNGKDTTALISLEDYWSSLPDGNYTVSFKVEDDNGNIFDAATPTLWFIKDTNAPNIIIHSEQGITSNITTPTFNVTFMDDFSLSKAFYKLDDSDSWVSLFDDANIPFYYVEFTLETALWNTISEGAHNIYFNFSDIAGNMNISSNPSILFYYDDVRPWYTIFSENGTYYNSNPVIDVDFFDETSLENGYYQIDGYSDSGMWNTIFYGISNSSFTYNFTMDESIWEILEEGKHTVYFKSIDSDNCEMFNSSLAWCLIKDTTSPQISIINYPIGTNLTENVNLNCSVRDEFFLTRIVYNWDGMENQTIYIHSNIENITQYVTIDYPGIGDHVLNIYAYDSAGNEKIFIENFKFIESTPGKNREVIIFSIFAGAATSVIILIFIKKKSKKRIEK